MWGEIRRWVEIYGDVPWFEETCGALCRSVKTWRDMRRRVKTWRLRGSDKTNVQRCTEMWGHKEMCGDMWRHREMRVHIKRLVEPCADVMRCKVTCGDVRRNRKGSEGRWRVMQVWADVIKEVKMWRHKEMCGDVTLRLWRCMKMYGDVKRTGDVYKHVDTWEDVEARADVRRCEKICVEKCADVCRWVETLWNVWRHMKKWGDVKTHKTWGDRRRVRSYKEESVRLCV